uniref:Uncharacterized protein n=1 Tax=Romanomermis culicivorax TaxID=13658 RepID=A0A915K0G1_ROMCU
MTTPEHQPKLKMRRKLQRLSISIESKLATGAGHRSLFRMTVKIVGGTTPQSHMDSDQDLECVLYLTPSTTDRRESMRPEFTKKNGLNGGSSRTGPLRAECQAMIKSQIGLTRINFVMNDEHSREKRHKNRFQSRLFEECTYGFVM